MQSRSIKWIWLALAAASVALLSGCCELAYRQAIACQSAACRPPFPPVSLPPEPTAVLSSDRGLIDLGDAITLTWHTEHAATVTIDPIGQVQTNGSLTVTPSGSTKYHLVAEGPGGVDVSTVWITVEPPPTPAVAPRGPETDTGPTAPQFQSIFFDYDQYAIRPDQQQAIESNRQLLLEHSDIRIVIEGYCDDHGATEYNLTLGEERAEAVKQFLVEEGVSAERITTASFGKEKPVCVEHTEDCARRNRRAEIVQEEQTSHPLN